MSSILFYDPLCQRPYDTRNLATTALGGTESTLTRIADALDAFVIQHNRTEDWGRYRSPQRIEGIERVIVIRDSRALPWVRERYPHARSYLWLHDRLRPGSRRARWLAGTAAILRDMAVTAVCVSDWQRRGVEATLERIGVAGRVRAVTLYNPVDDALVPDATPVDPNKLVFFSSPNKGLHFALDVFATLKRAIPALRLVVGNPGYKSAPGVRRDGVEFLGAQRQPRMHAEVRSALCTFHPNFLIPETFGLVFAESHALGTPVLTLDCGAAREIVGDAEEVLPMRDAYRLYEAAFGALAPSWRLLPARLAGAAGLFDAYVERIRAWHEGARPKAAPDVRFRLRSVTAGWRALLAL